MSKSGLSAKFVDNICREGKYYDKFGLYLRVYPSGGKYWEQRFTKSGKRETVGIGQYRDVTLKAARDAALDNLRRARGIRGRKDRAAGSVVPTLVEAAQRVLKLHAPKWSHPRQADIWYRSLERYVFLRLGDLPVSDITSDHLLEVLAPIWTSLNDTAQRVRQRLGTIMKWAIAQRYRTDNPAEAVLGALPRVKRSKSHYAALPHAEVAAALLRVRNSGAFLATRLAFEFLVLTATRSGEARLARWSEIDIDNARWTIPSDRMKARVAHRVPLSARALVVLKEARGLPGGDLVFPSRAGKVISDGTVSMLLKRLGIKAVPHGFRSSFRDWCGETAVPREVAEACLAHVIANKVEAAYARSDLYGRRMPVMEDWAKYVTAGPGPCAPADGTSGGRS